jgi:hypothetical protein
MFKTSNSELNVHMLVIQANLCFKRQAGLFGTPYCAVHLDSAGSCDSGAETRPVGGYCQHVTTLELLSGFS